jgi:hypothetical protein
MVEIHNPHRAEQLSLLSPDELARVRPLVPPPQESEEAGPPEAPCRDGEEHVARKNSYIQEILPSL